MPIYIPGNFVTLKPGNLWLGIMPLLKLEGVTQILNFVGAWVIMTDPDLINHSKIALKTNRPDLVLYLHSWYQTTKL